jgi:hypothetical protein
MMKGAGVVPAEVRMLKGVGTVDFMCLRVEEPEMLEGFSRDEFELGQSIVVGSRSPKVGNKGVD